MQQPSRTYFQTPPHIPWETKAWSCWASWDTGEHWPSAVLQMMRPEPETGRGLPRAASKSGTQRRSKPRSCLPTLIPSPKIFAEKSSRQSKHHLRFHHPESSMASLPEYSSNVLSVNIHNDEYLGNLVSFSFKYSVAGTQSWPCICETCDIPVAPQAEGCFPWSFILSRDSIMPPFKHQEGFDFSIHIFMPLSLLWFLPPKSFSA